MGCQPLDIVFAVDRIQWGFTGSGVYSGADDTVVMRLCRLYKQVQMHRRHIDNLMTKKAHTVLPA